MVEGDPVGVVAREARRRRGARLRLARAAARGQHGACQGLPSSGRGAWRVVVMAQGQVRHHGASADPATHQALVDVFDRRIAIDAIEGRWVALPKTG